MDTLRLANTLHAMHRTLSRANPRLSEQCEIGPMLVTVDATSREPFASSNRNRAAAAGRPVLRSELDSLMDFWKARNITRHFLWLSPGSDDPQSIAQAAACGYAAVPHMRYMILARPASPPPPGVPSGLRVVRLAAADIDLQAESLAQVFASEHAPGSMRAMCGLDGCELLGVMHGTDLIAAAMVYCAGELAYLGWAATRENARGRGAQSMLIAERVRLAAAAGCGWCVSETNSMAPTSLRNLGRAGFVPRYEMVVMASGN